MTETPQGPDEPGQTPGSPAPPPLPEPGWGQAPPPPPPPPPVAAYPAPSSTNAMAIASFVLGLVWFCGLGSVLAVIFGIVARQQIKRTGESGDGLAIAGLVLGLLGVGLWVLWVALFFVGAFLPTG